MAVADVLCVGTRAVRENFRGIVRRGGRDRLHPIEQRVPAVRWLRTYDVDNYLKADLIAGITVGTMLVPQPMSYARLAGLHPIYGLYSGFIPVFAYAIFGSSCQLAIGPVALVSLLISNGLTPLVDLAEEGADFKWQPFVMGSLVLVGLLIMKHVGKTFKCLRFFCAAGPVMAVFCSTVFVKQVHPSSISGIFSQPPFLT
ncbi:unnamed protein product [Sphagnum troendelagicum]